MQTINMILLVSVPDTSQTGSFFTIFQVLPIISFLAPPFSNHMTFLIIINVTSVNIVQGLNKWQQDKYLVNTL